LIQALAIAIGLGVLVAGGELVVRGAARLALSLRLSPVVVGLTVVAFGTSSPELAVSLGATLEGSEGVAVGNVVGSNIYNVLLILGVAALLRPLLVQRQLVRFDVPLVIAASVLMWLLVLDGSLAAAEGAALVAFLLLYIAVTVRMGRLEPSKVQAEFQAEMPTAPTPGRARLRDAGIFLAGLAALVVGAQLLVDGATSLAQAAGVSELVVGLTIVAVGTSLPELVTSAVAALRGHRDIAVGNVMGSNLFNILGILGLSAVAAGDGIPVSKQTLELGIPVMTVVAFACLPFLFTGHELRRWEGALFVTYAVLFTVFVVLGATDHPLGDPFADAMLWFVLPLTAVTIATVLVRELASQRVRSP
jgi:cation:H+ antiporter